MGGSKKLRRARMTPVRAHVVRFTGFHRLTQEAEKELNAVCDKFNSNLWGTHVNGPIGKLQRQRMLAFANKQRRRLRGNQWRIYDRMFVLDQASWVLRMQDNKKPA